VQLPAEIGGEAGAFCTLAQLGAAAVAEQILPRHGVLGRRCMVHELFVNVQKSGAWTNPHVHTEDFYGGIFYVDAPRAPSISAELAPSAAVIASCGTAHLLIAS
jgi:hypothetical protein